MDAADHLDLVVTDLERSPAFHRGLLGPLGHSAREPDRRRIAELETRLAALERPGGA